MPGSVAGTGGRNKYLIGFIGTSKEEQSHDQAILTQEIGAIAKTEEAACRHEIELPRCVCEVGGRRGAVSGLRQLGC